MYIWSYDTAVSLLLPGAKVSCYATIVYLPENYTVDFGVQPYPPILKKKTSSPRVLLVSSWTDGRFGFVGGGCKAGESPIEAVNREFLEEVGTPEIFSAEDFVCCEMGKRATFAFVKKTHDLSAFNQILASFYTTERAAYPDEVMAICGYPIWIEGPPGSGEDTWNIWGLPRHLTSQGGMMTPTLGEKYLNL
jgi:hypothetical protein